MEGIVRLAANLPFDKSRHSVDSGLFGVLGLSGILGSRRANSSKKRRQPSSHNLSQTPFLTQDAYSSPTSQRESFNFGSSRTIPSVLRPEQIRTPYREDSDDEFGHILGAWNSFSHLQEDPPPPPREPPRTGFARVGGGRAHHESPYAIRPSTPKPFPSFESQPQSYSAGQTATPLTPLRPSSSATSLPTDAASVQRLRAHARTKSQTAVIEDVRLTPITTPSSVARNAEAATQSSSQPHGEEDGDTDAAPKKRHWFDRKGSHADASGSTSSRWGFLRGRRRSEGDEVAVDDNDDGALPPSGPSFVVIRDKRPSAPLPLSHYQSRSEESGQPPSQWRELSSTSVPPPERPPRSVRRISNTS